MAGQRRWLLAAAGVVGALVLGLWCFEAVLFRGEQFGYRDAAHFYHPLYLRVQQEWEAGRVPLWEPGENGGMPLLGNPTAAVLYPGKLVFAVLDYEWATRVYTIGHVALAAVGAALLMRGWGVSWCGASITGLSYAFGAPVLFQYCNIVFLVGAAWLPFGLRAVDRWLRLGQRWGLVELAVVLALQTLGGDPQTSYVTGLFAGSYALALWWAGAGVRSARTWRWLGVLTVLIVGVWVAAVLGYAAATAPEGGAELAARAARATSNQPAESLGISPKLWSRVLVVLWGLAGLWLMFRARSSGSRWLRGRLVGLGVAAGLAFAVMGAQLLPTMEFTSRTVRAAEDGSHGFFPFSLEPYRLLELAWPEPFGSAMTGRYWLQAVPPARNVKVWVPSLYLGGVVLLLAVVGAGFRGGPAWRGWLSAIAVASVLLSVGEFGSPLWLARHLPGAAAVVGPHDPLDFGELRRDGYLADGFGSPYWLVAWSCPGFREFRYPSKFLTYSSLGIAGLAGVGWDLLAGGRRRRRLVVSGGLLLTAGVAGLIFWASWREGFLAFLAGQTTGVLGSAFGPFDAQGAWRDTLRSLVHGNVAMAIAVSLGLACRRWPVAAGVVAIGVLAVDLGLASSRYVRTVPVSMFSMEQTPEVLARVEADREARGAKGPYRIHRMSLWEPTAWREEASEDRVRDLVEWERKTIQPKYALPFGAAYTLTEGTAELYDYWFFFAPFFGNHGDAVGQQYGLKPGEKLVYFPRRGYDLWNSEYFVLPMVPANDERRGYVSFLPNTVPVYPLAETFSGEVGEAKRDEWIKRQDWQILRNEAVYPRAWVVHQARRIEPITGMGREGRKVLMEEIVYQADEFWRNRDRILWNPRELAWVEIEGSRALSPLPSGGLAEVDETVAVVKYEPQEVVLEARLDRPGIVVLADVFYPGWKLWVDDEPTEILRVNRVMRGVAVGAGTHRLVYRYEPASFRVGQVLSAVGLVGLVGLSAWCWRRERRETVGEGD